MSYIDDVLKTESNDYEKIKCRLNTRKVARLLHGAIGLSTEAGELEDSLKKHIFYGKDIDEVNLKEEIGDCLWYIAILLHELKSSFEEAQEINIKKLFTRYGISFNETSAINRDLDSERRILESRASIQEQLDSLTDTQRLDLFGQYCFGCGRKGACYCRRDD